MPDLVMYLTTVPELRPYSALKLLLTTWSSPSTSGLERNTNGPATELSLFAWPSIWKLFERPRRPLLAIAAPLVLLKFVEPLLATPGMNSARLSKPAPALGRARTTLLSNVPPICELVLLTRVTEGSTITNSEDARTTRVPAP